MTKVLSICLFATIYLVAVFPSTGQAQVTLTVGDGSGAVGSDERPIEGALNNPSEKVSAVTVDICDVDDYLSCAECEPTERSSDFPCIANELENGCVRVVLVDFFGDSLIEEGNGPVFTLLCDVSSSAPQGECRDLNPENVSVANENNIELDVSSAPGEFCFLTDIVTTTTSRRTSTTTTSVLPTFTIYGEITGDVSSNIPIILSGAVSKTIRTDFTGYYEFSDLESGYYIITPELEGYIFEPPDYVIQQLTTDLFDLDFIATAIQETTTSSESVLFCLIEDLYGEDSYEVELLRSLRDNVLSKTQEGQELIKLYYQWSPVIVRVMEADEEFKQEVKDMVDEVLGVVE